MKLTEIYKQIHQQKRFLREHLKVDIDDSLTGKSVTVRILELSEAQRRDILNAVDEISRLWFEALMTQESALFSGIRHLNDYAKVLHDRHDHIRPPID